MMEKSRRGALAIVIPLIVGITALMTVLARSRAAQYATVDILELVAAGMCFGVAIVALARAIRGKDAA
jgi:uncharacterized protein YoaH (UPF0181 family)